VNAPRSRGFTLIEMVIAFAILGITLAALYGTFASSLSRTRHDARLSEATLVVQSLLARAGSEWPLAVGSQSGNWESYQYEVDEQTADPAQGQPPYTLPIVRVTASVAWHEGANLRHIAVSTLKLLPAVTP
jgi:general secretion pathway protein I